MIAALSFLPVKIIAGVALALTLASGVYMIKNQERLFGHDPDYPRETSGERVYSKAQLWLIWALMVKGLAFLTFII
ncbi:MAG: hypothetical protein ACAI34_23520 [Verrucomicrobium sp.]|nr:hypothetical protein [Verrucomicrobium sp.]